MGFIADAELVLPVLYVWDAGYRRPSGPCRETRDSGGEAGIRIFAAALIDQPPVFEVSDGDLGTSANRKLFVRSAVQLWASCPSLMYGAEYVVVAREDGHTRCVSTGLCADAVCACRPHSRPLRDLPGEVWPSHKRFRSAKFRKRRNQCSLGQPGQLSQVRKKVGIAGELGQPTRS